MDRGGNYGTGLQCFALYHKLTNMGHEVLLMLPMGKTFIGVAYLKAVLSALGIIRWIKKRRMSKKNKLQKFYLFNEENIKTINVYTKFQLKKIVKNTDLFITGSDQIWNAYYNYSPFCFLDFAKDKKRIAYASSIGTTDFPENYKKEICGHLLKFAHIGVREQTAVNVITKLTGRNDVVQVLDPTFLLNDKEWKKVASSAQIEFELPKKYILCYLIGDNEWYSKQVEHIKAKTGIKDAIVIPSAENRKFSLQNAYIYEDAGPKEFVWLIQHATLVCTDSFHATALSINMSIDFVEFLRFKDTDKSSQNSRIYDLLEHYQLQSRFYSQENEDWSKSISYEYVKQILELDRINSLKFLTNSIES